MIALVVKATVILIVALASHRLARRTRASVCHLILLAAFAALIAVPVAMQFLPDVAIPIPAARAMLGPVAVFVVDAPVSNVAPESAPTATAAIPVVTRSTLIATAWMLGAIVCVMPVLGAFAHTRRMRKAATPWRDGLIALLEDCPGPLTIGIARPLIVFPREAVHWPADDVRRAIVHEMEHVRRRDCLIDTIARLVCAAYWFHPLVWIALRHLRLDAERACDDAVVGSDVDVAYAEQLIALAERLATRRDVFAMAMASGSDLSARVRALLDVDQRRGRIGRVWATAIVAATVIVGGSIASLSAVSSSQGAQQRLAFEVASIKENTSGHPNAGGDRFDTRIYPGGRFMARNMTLHDLVLIAYRDEFAASQISGFADWMLEKRFDIEAKAATGEIPTGDLTRATAQQLRWMQRSLLVDRFALRVHREEKIGELHVLSVAPGGHKMKRNTDATPCASSRQQNAPPWAGCHSLRMGRTGLDGSAVDTADIAGALQAFLQRPVIDRANLTELYQVSARWNSGPPGPLSRPDALVTEPQPSPDDPDIYTAMRQQLGLKLDTERKLLPVLVVESAAMPQEN